MHCCHKSRKRLKLQCIRHDTTRYKVALPGNSKKLFVVIPVITKINRTCMVASPARGQQNKENGVFYCTVPVPVREVRLARQVRPSRPPSDCSFAIPKLNIVLTCRLPAFLPLSTTAFIYTVNRCRVTPEFMRSPSCMSMTSTAESLPAQGQ